MGGSQIQNALSKGYGTIWGLRPTKGTHCVHLNRMSPIADLQELECVGIMSAQELNGEHALWHPECYTRIVDRSAWEVSDSVEALLRRTGSPWVAI